MALLSLAVAGGVTFLAWKTLAPTTKWVLLTLVMATIYDDVLFDDSDFGPGDLMLSSVGAMAVLGVVA